MSHEQAYLEVIRILARLEPQGTFAEVVKRMRHSGVPPKTLAELYHKAIDEGIIGVVPGDDTCVIICKPANCKYCLICG